MSRASIQFTLNNRLETFDAEADDVLLDVLRDTFHLTGTKEGCREGECGACTVLVNGRAVDSCIYPACGVVDCEVETIEGVSHAGPTSLQQAMLVENGVQCGFCTPGFVVMLEGVLRTTPAPSDDEIREALSGNICRCTGYAGIVRAVRSILDATTNGSETGR